MKLKTLANPAHRNKRDSSTSLSETAGEVFDDCVIELVRDAQTGHPTLLLHKGGVSTVGAKIRHGGKVFVAAQLEQSVARSLTLPTTPANYGNTSRLFEAVNSVFLEGGFSSPVSDASSLFVLSTWLSDVLPEPPCLVITGARREALYLLELVAGFARRSLPPLLAPKISALASLLTPGLAPTLLINAQPLRAHKLDQWFASSARSSHVIARGRLVDFSTARAIFVGETPEALPLDQPLLIINVDPSNGPPTITRDRQAKMTSRFQGQLLAYRLRNLRTVQQSTIDLPKAPAAMRTLARTLCASIVQAPELQARARQVIENQRQLYAEQFWLDPRMLVVEAALARAHDPNQTGILVRDLAADVIALSASRGQQRDFEPRKVGAIRNPPGTFSRRLQIEVHKRKPRNATSFVAIVRNSGH